MKANRRKSTLLREQVFFFEFCPNLLKEYTRDYLEIKMVVGAAAIQSSESNAHAKELY